MMEHIFDRLGMRVAPIAGPLKIFQEDRFVGTVPGYPVVSTSFIFDVRPGDFKVEERDGEKVLVASPMIGPGDFECLAGFRNQHGVETGKGEIAAMFDAMATVAGLRR
jgi:hypothetical protein